MGYLSLFKPPDSFSGDIKVVGSTVFDGKDPRWQRKSQIVLSHYGIGAPRPARIYL
jgi:hypothetical protein